MRRLVGGYRWGWVQYKMFAGDQGREGLIRHWHMLHGTCLDELRRDTRKPRKTRYKHPARCSLIIHIKNKKMANHPVNSPPKGSGSAPYSHCEAGYGGVLEAR